MISSILQLKYMNTQKLNCQDNINLNDANHLTYQIHLMSSSSHTETINYYGAILQMREPKKLKTLKPPHYPYTCLAFPLSFQFSL